MADDGQPWYSSVVKYVVLPIGVLVAIYFIVTSFFGGNKARQDAIDQITKIWDEYDVEYKDFISDGQLTQQERDILDAKLGLLKEPIKAISDTIPNINSAITTLILAVVGAILAYELLTHRDKISPNWARVRDAIQGKLGSILHPEYSVETTFSTPEELGQMFRLFAIMDIADAGNPAQASNLLQAEQTGYFTNLLPQMATSYNILTAQLPLLQGMQLYVAQYQLQTYTVYMTAYVSALPPIFILPPII